MKKLVLIVAVFVLIPAGVIIALYFRSGFAFGIDSEHPLGQIGKLEQQLIRAGLVKDEAKLNSLTKLFLGQQVLYYGDEKTLGGGDYEDFITVVSDTEGVVEEFKARFRPLATQARDLSGLTVRVLSRLYWKSVGGGKIDFQAGKGGLFGLSENPEMAEFSTTRVSGRWVRSPEVETLEIGMK